MTETPNLNSDIQDATKTPSKDGDDLFIPEEVNRYRSFKEFEEIYLNVKNKTDEWLQKLGGIEDSQLLNFYVAEHCAGHLVSKFKITCGELRRQILAALASDNLTSFYDGYLPIDFGNGNGVDLAYHDFYGIEAVTPELKIAEEKEGRILNDIAELEKLGVDRDLFYANKTGEPYKRKFDPEQVVKFSKIIEQYLAGKKGDF